MVGVAAFELKREALTSRKAWFFFSDGVVCLGSDINCDETFEVVTTINQCRLSGPVTLGKDNATETFPEGDATENVQWVHHDGIGYLFPKESQISLSAGARTGSWKRISAQRSDQTVTDSVFTITLPHGARPQGKSYAYAVFPGKQSTDMLDLVDRMPLEILTNSAQQQAVWCENDKTLGIVFHQPSQFQAPRWQVTPDRACVVLLRYTDGAWTLSAADPATGAGTLNLEVKTEGEAPRQVTLTLPDGLKAGSSVHAIL
jgi:chondroitin AC lyase